MNTERQIPREFVGLWQGICAQVLEELAPMDQEGPDRSDLFFVLPKLARPPRGPSPAKKGLND